MELNRAKSFNYSRLNLRGLGELATLEEWVSVDLWHFQTKDVRGIRKAPDFTQPYDETPPKKWPFKQTVSIHREELAGMFRLAALAYG